MTPLMKCSEDNKRSFEKVINSLNANGNTNIANATLIAF